MDKLKIDLLLKYQDESLNNKNKQIIFIFKEFKEKYEKSSLKDQKQIREYISALPRPTSIKVNTIGSYLFGCNQNYYGDTEKNNSLLCYNNINEEKLTPNKQIWVSNNKKPNRFRQINYPERYDHGYIYVEDDFNQFTQQEIEMFRSYNLRKISIYTTQNMKHIIYKDYDNINLDLAPQEPKIKLESEYVTLKKKFNDNYNWIIIVVLILLILIFLFYFFQKRKIEDNFKRKS